MQVLGHSLFDFDEETGIEARLIWLSVDRRLVTHISASETVWFAWMGHGRGKEEIVDGE